MLSLPDVTEISGAVDAFSYGEIQATAGGRINLPAVTQITGPAGGSSNTRGIRISADGPNSSVDLSALGIFTNDAGGPDSRLTATNGGSISVPQLTQTDGVFHCLRWLRKS